MHLCINCGSDKVERQGDDFTCHKCQFYWDVALEQANQIYLRSQGRQPAKSILETATATGPVTLPPNPASTPTDQQPIAPQGAAPSDVPTAENTAGDGQSPLAASAPKPSGKKANS